MGFLRKKTTLSDPNTSTIDQSWPLENVENVGACPYCESTKRVLEYPNVQDWAFQCAPGKWNYWACQDCSALYLDPRPTQESIGRAYSTYYTHGLTKGSYALSASKSLIRNLCYFAWFGIKLSPRLPFPRFMFPLLSIFRRRIAPPSFILQALSRLPKGKVIDVGCGNGQFLDAAKQLGWNTLGIEIDPEAVKVVRASGHDVIQGTYEALGDFDNEIDCVICSHVLEHVHDPKSLLLAIARALKVGGTTLISLPNAGSIVLLTLQENWRGLEAPRHLAIPTFEGILNLTRALGFETEATFVSRFETLDESLAIAKLRGTDTQESRKKVAVLQEGVGQVSETNSDFINLILKKTATQSELPAEHG